MRLSLDPDRTTRVAIDSLAYADGRARLRWTETLEGDALQRLLGLRLPDLASARIAGVPVNGATRSILTTEIVTLPDTLQPVSVRMEADADTAAAGTSSHIYSGRTWTFDWSAARCKPESAPSTAVTPSH